MNDEDIKILEIYRSNSEKLQKAVNTHIPKKTTIKYRTNKPIEIEGTIDETIEAGLLGSARLFLGDNTSKFERVVNILRKHHKKEREKTLRLSEYQNVWKIIFGPHVLFRIGSEKDNLTNEKVFDMIANGSYLHSDIDKFDQHFELQQSWVYPMLRIQLQSMITDISKITTMLNFEFIEPILDLNNSKIKII